MLKGQVDQSYEITLKVDFIYIIPGDNRNRLALRVSQEVLLVTP